MINSLTFISTKFKKLKPAKPMPLVSDTKAEAVAFFQGWWNGIFVGVVLGAALAVVLLPLIGKFKRPEKF